MNAPFAHMILGSFIAVGGIGLMISTWFVDMWDWRGEHIPFSLLFAAAGSAATVYGVVTIATAYGDPYHVKAFTLLLTIPPIFVFQFLATKKRWNK